MLDECSMNTVRIRAVKQVRMGRFGMSTPWLSLQWFLVDDLGWPSVRRGCSPAVHDPVGVDAVQRIRTGLPAFGQGGERFLINRNLLVKSSAILESMTVQQTGRSGVDCVSTADGTGPWTVSRHEPRGGGPGSASVLRLNSTCRSRARLGSASSAQ
nr:hypothetical protein CFP56_19538 [Quercus suber]